MREFIEWINSKEILEKDPIIRAGLTHYHLALIHPFSDGNGRTARVIEALLLQKAGIKYAPAMLSNYYYRNIDEYFWAFSNSIKNKEKDITQFLEFYLKGLIESLNEIKKRIIFFIRMFTLRDFYVHLKKAKKISSRQNDLLLMLLDDLKSFTIDDLSNNSPFNILYRKVSVRTIRRDLKKLHDEKLLVIENGKYALNLNILD